MRLQDVANVVTDHQPMIGDAVINSGPGLMLIVEKLPWANTLDVTKGVEAAIDSMRPGLPDMEIDTTIFRPATFIETSLKNLSSALLLGCLLMIVMLFLFLYEWRVALISVVTIPLSLVAASLVLAWRGTTINTMILAGFAIALGDIVDDAIIDIENVVRRLRQHRAEGRTGLDGRRDPARLARGAQRDRLRHHHRDRGRRAGAVPGRAVGGVLPAAGHLVRASRSWSRWSWP